MTYHQGHPPGYQPAYQPAYQPPYQPPYQPHPEKPAPVIHQPQQVQSTNVVVNTGGGGGGGGDGGGQYIRRRGWSTGFCGCCEDVGGCCCVMVCVPYQIFSLTTRLDEVVCLPCLVPQWLMALRIKMRESNHIAGSIFTDCLATTYCPHLAMCQMIRELDNIDRKKPGTDL